MAKTSLRYVGEEMPLNPSGRRTVTDRAEDWSDIVVGQAQFTTDRGCDLVRGNKGVPYDSTERAKYDPFEALAQPGMQKSSKRHSL